MYYFFFLFLYLFSFELFSQEGSQVFPQPAQAILSKYVKDQEIANSITVDAAQIHWRNAENKIGIKYFSLAELEDLVISVNEKGLLTYKGVLLVPGSYSYILSKEGKLLAFLRKNDEGVNLNQDLTEWFRKQPLKKCPLFSKVVCKHSSLSHGEPVLAVGDFEVYDAGVAAFFNNASGHYRLQPISMKNMAYYLHEAGVKEARFDLFYKAPNKKVRKKISSLSEVLKAPDNDPLFADLP